MVVPATANTSEVARRRSLVLLGQLEFCLSVLQSLRMISEDKSKIRAQSTA